MIDDVTLERAKDCIVEKGWTPRVTASFLKIENVNKLETALYAKYPHLKKSRGQERKPHLS